MSDLLTLAQTVKELGSTVLVVAAAIWILAKYLPSQMRQQGETNEVLRHTAAVINNNTKVLELVSVKDDELKQTLERIEEELNMTARDVRYIKINTERNEHE